MSLIQEAEQNVINVSKEIHELMKVLESVRYACNKYLEWGDDAREYNEAWIKIYRLMSLKYYQNIDKSFCFTGIGGDKAKEYAYEKFKEYFNDDRCVENFLNKNGITPDSFKYEKSDNLKKEAKEIMKGKKNG